MKKILVIDDQPEIRALVGRALDVFGYEHRNAHNGDEALRLCASWRPDAVLTDIFMPEKDGLEIIRELRKSLPGVPILAMSGGGGAGNMDILHSARLMGARRVLAKPFSMKELKQVLAEITGNDPSGYTPDGMVDGSPADPVRRL